ncbi:CoA transferase [Ferrimicrobium sp.]|uniref:CaiB/BaiF CoA transferase family protein n=1 Tax=Ferrimicrobium sp. TaxID=2926050 RepID=UPI002626021F|nr:CoA transferase [Ferrimicrobium sp.]
MEPEDGRAKESDGPLTGLLIADFSRILAGPYATMLLGDLGATVIKVEGPSGDDTRTWKPPVRGDVATYYLGINRNKRSIVLNLADADDKRLALRLAQRADVMIENFKPGQISRFGLGYETLCEENPGLVYASISGFGTKPPGSGMMGYDLMIQAMSGLMSLTGEPEGPAYRAGISVIDIISGLHLAMGILAALYERATSGLGQHVEVSLLTSALSGLVNHTAAVTMGGVVPFRMGNAHPSLYPYDPFATQDGELIVIAANDGQFRSLTMAIGAPELADDPRFSRNELRTANRDILGPLLQERLRTKTSDEWFALLTAAGVPCAPIATVDRGIAFAKEVGLEPTVLLGEGGDRLEMIRNPITFSATPPSYRLRPPALGADGDAIRAWLLDESELD